MKMPHFFALLFLFVLVFLIIVRSGAQNSRPVPQDEAMERYEDFVEYLMAAKQTNILARFDRFEAASQTLHNTAETSMDLALLKLIRSGRTNEAIDVLETKLDGALIALSFHTNEIREPQLEVLRNAKQ